MKGLKSFRERAGYRTQTALAKELNRTTVNVSDWELGKGFPSYSVIKCLFELGATVEELFDFEYEEMHDLTKKDIDANVHDEVKNLKKQIKDIEKREKIKEEVARIENILSDMSDLKLDMQKFIKYGDRTIDVEDIIKVDIEYFRNDGHLLINFRVEEEITKKYQRCQIKRFASERKYNNLVKLFYTLGSIADELYYFANNCEEIFDLGKFFNNDTNLEQEEKLDWDEVVAKQEKASELLEKIYEARGAAYMHVEDVMRGEEEKSTDYDGAYFKALKEYAKYANLPTPKEPPPASDDYWI